MSVATITRFHVQLERTSTLVALLHALTARQAISR